MRSRNVAFEPIVIRDGREGLEDIKNLRRQCEDPNFVASCLVRHQRWRRGVGEYKFNENPLKNKPAPYSPRALTIIEGAAIRMLGAYKRLLSDFHRFSGRK